MAIRTPVVLFLGTLTTTASASAYTVPANSSLTISAATFNNTTGAGVTVSAQVTPSGGSALPIVSALTVPASGAAPTTVPGLVGQSLAAGGKLELSAGANSSINGWVSGYLQQ